MLLWMTGCATRTVERPIHNHNGVVVTLRHNVVDEAPVDPGYEHPSEISRKTLEKILQSIVIRIEEDDEQVEKPAIAPILVSRVASGLHDALAAANSSEEVSVTAVRHARRLGIFSQKFLTSFVAFVNDGMLTISLSRVEWDIAIGNKSRATRERLPQPKLNDEVMDFRVVESEGIQVAGEQIARARLPDDG